MALVGTHRRLPEVLIDQWDEVRAGRSFPTEQDLNANTIDELGFWEDCFLIKTRDIAKKDYNYSYFGQNLVNAYGEDLTNVSVYSFASPSAETLALKYEEVLATHVPITDEGEFLNARNIPVRYRQCMVPLGDGKKVHAILGAMRYRLYPGG